jgi:hypothetical protein
MCQPRLCLWRWQHAKQRPGVVSVLLHACYQTLRAASAGIPCQSGPVLVALEGPKAPTCSTCSTGWGDRSSKGVSLVCMATRCRLLLTSSSTRRAVQHTLLLGEWTHDQGCRRWDRGAGPPAPLPLLLFLLLQKQHPVLGWFLLVGLC